MQCENDVQKLILIFEQHSFSGLGDIGWESFVLVAYFKQWSLGVNTVFTDATVDVET